MGKTDWKAKAKSLKKKLKQALEDAAPVATQAAEAVAGAAGTVAGTAAGVVSGVVASVKAKAKQVSPLAPAAFPDLPVIAGAEFAAVEAGVRYKNRRDVMLVRLAPGTAVAGAFTRSSTRAGCVRDAQAKLALKAGDEGAAIVVNSGNSNAFTGKVGDQAVAAVCKATAAALGIPESRVFTSSTGVIGEPLPAERITARVPDLVAALTEAGIGAAAQAIMTTDTFPKGAAATLDLPEGQVRIAGIAKGSGMIAPDMATMLVYIFTDARVAQPALQRMLDRALPDTFNAITVDSDTSTSDALLLCATGKGAEVKGRGPLAAFEKALKGVMADLALQVVKDGEGATKLIEVRVTGAASEADAHRVAMAIANSPLVKTAVAGEDPNWGRIVMAVGKSGAQADRDRLTIRLGDLVVARDGWRAPDYKEEDGAAYMKGRELVIGVDLGLGRAARTVWTCDLTHRYIDINADYRS